MNFEFLSTFHLFMLKALKAENTATERKKKHQKLPTDSIPQILFLLFKEVEKQRKNEPSESLYKTMPSLLLINIPLFCDFK